MRNGHLSAEEQKRADEKTMKRMLIGIGVGAFLGVLAGSQIGGFYGHPLVGIGVGGFLGPLIGAFAAGRMG